MLNRSKTLNLKLALSITQPQGLLIFRRENNNNNNNNVSTHVGLLHMLYTS